MENERVISVIGRLERALSRIEMAESKGIMVDQDEALDRRHDALKKEMQQAIETIDNLIARQEN